MVLLVYFNCLLIYYFIKGTEADVWFQNVNDWVNLHNLQCFQKRQLRNDCSKHKKVWHQHGESIEED